MTHCPCVSSLPLFRKQSAFKQTQWTFAGDFQVPFPVSILAVSMDDSKVSLLQQPVLFHSYTLTGAYSLLLFNVLLTLIAVEFMHYVIASKSLRKVTSMFVGVLSIH